MPQTKCRICHKEFYVKPSHVKLGYGKFCSTKCRREGQKTGKYVICEKCGQQTWKTPRDFNRSKSGKYFCSKSCQTKWRNEFYSGDKHYYWRGGEYTYKNALIKSKAEQKCKMCGIKDKRLLIVHHLDHNRKNPKVENLVWLCRNCHYLVHNHDERVR